MGVEAPLDRLFTSRLVLRPLERADLGALVAWHSDEAVMRFIGAGRPFSPAETQMVLRRHLDAAARRGYGLMIAELRATGQMVGRVGFMDWDVDGEELVEIGWLIDPRFQREGYATEAGLVLRTYGFGELDQETLISVIHPDNSVSIRVAEKLGGEWWRSWITPGGAVAALYRYDRSRLRSDGNVDQNG